MDPRCCAELLRFRSRILKTIRLFFEERGVLEVETPLLYPAFATDPHLTPFVSRYSGAGRLHGQSLYLQSSPEYAMKRLLAQGSGSIFQLCKAFRNGDSGRQHNPEFTLLEWYRTGFDYHLLMDEVEALLKTLTEVRGVRKLSYCDFFAKHCSCNPLRVSVEALHVLLLQYDPSVEGMILDRSTCLDLLLDAIVQRCYRQQDELLMLYDYPAWQSQMAANHPENKQLVQRFECYVNGIELANGYQELEDVDEQRRRFIADNRQRAASGSEPMPYDEHYLAGLSGAFPKCAGVALGVDRLMMFVAGVETIQDVMPFPLEKL